MLKVSRDKIIAVTKVVDQVCNDIEWKEAKRSFWGSQAEGFRHKLSGEFLTKEYIESTWDTIYCRDKGVYFKTFLKFTLSNGGSCVKYFKTEEDLQKFLQDHSFDNVNWIDLE